MPRCRALAVRVGEGFTGPDPILPPNESESILESKVRGGSKTLDQKSEALSGGATGCQILASSNMHSSVLTAGSIHTVWTAA